MSMTQATLRNRLKTARCAITTPHVHVPKRMQYCGIAGLWWAVALEIKWVWVFNGAEDVPWVIQESPPIYSSKQSLCRWGTDVQGLYPIGSKQWSAMFRTMLTFWHTGKKESKRDRENQEEGGRESKKDGFRIYHPEVSIENLCSMERLLDQGRMAEWKVIEKFFLQAIWRVLWRWFDPENPQNHSFRRFKSSCSP